MLASARSNNARQQMAVQMRHSLALDRVVWRHNLTRPKVSKTKFSRALNGATPRQILTKLFYNLPDAKLTVQRVTLLSFTVLGHRQACSKSSRDQKTTVVILVALESDLLERIAVVVDYEGCLEALQRLHNALTG